MNAQSYLVIVMDPIPVQLGFQLWSDKKHLRLWNVSFEAVVIDELIIVVFLKNCQQRNLTKLVKQIITLKLFMFPLETE